MRARSGGKAAAEPSDRKSTRLNSSHMSISYAVFCLKKKNDHRVGPRAHGQQDRHETSRCDDVCAGHDDVCGGHDDDCAGHDYYCSRFFFNDTATTEIYTLSLHDALPIWNRLLVICKNAYLFATMIMTSVSSPLDRKSGSAGMPRPISYAVFCLKKKKNKQSGDKTSRKNKKNQPEERQETKTQ